MFIIIMGDVVDRTSPIIYNIDGVVLTSIQLKNAVLKGDRLLWKKLSK